MYKLQTHTHDIYIAFHITHILGICSFWLWKQEFVIVFLGDYRASLWIGEGSPWTLNPCNSGYLWSVPHCTFFLFAEKRAVLFNTSSHLVCQPVCHLVSFLQLFARTAAKLIYLKPLQTVCLISALCFLTERLHVSYDLLMFVRVENWTVMAVASLGSQIS